MSGKPIPPGSWLGLLGGGQLGRMFCMAAQSLGYKVCVLDPGSDSPAGAVADDHIARDYLDRTGLAELAARCRAATTEFENVPAAALSFLAEHCNVSPEAPSVAIAQDRIVEKRFVASCGIDVAPGHAPVCPGHTDDAVLALLVHHRRRHSGSGFRVAPHSDALNQPKLTLFGCFCNRLPQRRVGRFAGNRLDGNLPQWNPSGVVLTRVDATHWMITLTGKETTQIEYKYTLGDWDHVEKDNACGEIANRQLTLSYGSNGTQTVNDTVQNWRNVAPCGN